MIIFIIADNFQMISLDDSDNLNNEPNLNNFINACWRTDYYSYSC